MKRIGAMLCLVLLVVSMTAATCFGAEGALKIVDEYPRDGQKSTSIENMSVKLTFNNDMGNKESVAANADCFKITDNKGNALPIRVFYNPKDSKEVMVLADAVKIAESSDISVKDNTEYTLHISADVTDNEGNTLGRRSDGFFHNPESEAEHPGIYDYDGCYVRRYVHVLISPGQEEGR